MRIFLSSLFILLTFTGCGETGGNAPGSAGLAGGSHCNPCRIFVTDAQFNGALGGVDGADAKCMADVNYPSDGEFKAYITDFRDRAFDLPDWVVQPNTLYARPDGTVIVTSNALAQLVGPLTNPITTTAATAMTGGTPHHCDYWQDGTAGVSYLGGTTNSSTLFSGAVVRTCNLSARLYCIEQ